MWLRSGLVRGKVLLGGPSGKVPYKGDGQTKPLSRSLLSDRMWMRQALQEPHRWPSDFEAKSCAGIIQQSVRRSLGSWWEWSCHLPTSRLHFCERKINSLVQAPGFVTFLFLHSLTSINMIIKDVKEYLKKQLKNTDRVSQW